MSKTDHLARAKDYIAKGDSYHRKAVEEIVAAIKDEPTLSHAAIAKRVGKSPRWVGHLVQSFTNAQDLRDFKVEWGSEKPSTTARKALRDPDQRRQVIESLEPDEVDELVEQANEVAISRSRSRRAEHDTSPTTRELMGNDRFDPSENWADNLILRLHTNTRALDKLIQRAGGVILGSLSREEAFEYLQEAERQIAEARAAVQEQLRDEVQV